MWFGKKTYFDQFCQLSIFVGNYPSPKKPKVRRLLAGFDTDKFEQTIPQNQQQIRREPDPEKLSHIDGKQPSHSSGDAVLTAVTSPSRSYLGSALVPTKKIDKIPEARALFEKLDLDRRIVRLDALHTQDKTAQAFVLAHGANYFLTVKDNQPSRSGKSQRRAAGNFFPARAHACRR